MVLGLEEAILFEQYYSKEGSNVPYIPESSFIPVTANNVDLPEDRSLTRNWDMEYVLVSQNYPTERQN